MRLKTTYLQMFAHPERIVPPPRGGLAIVHAKKPPTARPPGVRKRGMDRYGRMADLSLAQGDNGSR
jgi:hypothetical protein